MKKRLLSWLVLVALLVSMTGALADGINGEWVGTVTAEAPEFTTSDNKITTGCMATFKDGTWTISIRGATENGKYTLSGDTLTVTSNSLKRIPVPTPLAFTYTLKDGKLVISGATLGIKGTMTLTPWSPKK